MTPRDREAFEAWWKSTGRLHRFELDRTGDYFNAQVQCEWSAWQAAVESERARYAGVVEAARRPDVIQPWERTMAHMLRITYEMHLTYPDNDPWITVAKRAIVAALAALDGAHE